MDDSKYGGIEAALFLAALGAATVPFLLASPHLPLLAPGLPASALSVVCPTAAALLVSRLRGGSRGLRALLARARVPADSREWRACAVATCLPVLVTVLSIGWQGTPPSNDGWEKLSPATLGLVFVFIAGAFLEELGWSGFLTEALARKCGLVATGLLIGLLWASWHYLPLVQVGRSVDWIAWWTLGTISMRLTLVSLYMHGRRNVWIPTLFHAADSACWQGQELLGVSFDPRVHAVAMVIVATSIVAVRFQRHSSANESSAP